MQSSSKYHTNKIFKQWKFSWVTVTVTGKVIALSSQSPYYHTNQTMQSSLKSHTNKIFKLRSKHTYHYMPFLLQHDQSLFWHHGTLSLLLLLLHLHHCQWVKILPWPKPTDRRKKSLSTKNNDKSLSPNLKSESVEPGLQTFGCLNLIGTFLVSLSIIFSNKQVNYQTIW